eukprot:9498207-Pyramimonas_sp.AAC.1
MLACCPRSARVSLASVILLFWLMTGMRRRGISRCQDFHARPESRRWLRRCQRASPPRPIARFFAVNVVSKRLLASASADATWAKRHHRPISFG